MLIELSALGGFERSKEFIQGFPSRWWISSPTPVDTKDRYHLGLLTCGNQEQPFIQRFLIIISCYLVKIGLNRLLELPSCHLCMFAWHS